MLLSEVYAGLLTEATGKQANDSKPGVMSAVENKTSRQREERQDYWQVKEGAEPSIRDARREVNWWEGMFEQRLQEEKSYTTSF